MERFNELNARFYVLRDQCELLKGAMIAEADRLDAEASELIKRIGRAPEDPWWKQNIEPRLQKVKILREWANIIF